MGSGFDESDVTWTRTGTEVWDWEDVLAHSRLILGVVCTITICLSPASLGKNLDLGRLLILLYLTFGLFNLIAVRLHWHYGRAGAVGLHTADLVIISLITMFTGGVQSTFLGLFLFVILAAACQWGLNGALLTSCSCVAFLLFCLTLPAFRSARAPSFMVGGSAFLATMALSAGLVSSACLLGLIVERERRKYGDGIAIARLVRSIIPEPSFKEALGNTLKSLRDYFDADQVRLALQELKGDKAFAWDVNRETGKGPAGVQSWTLTETVRRGSFAMPPVEVQRGLGLGWLGGETSNRGISAGLLSGLRRRSASAKQGDGLDDLHIVSERHSPFVGSWSMLATSFAFERKWLGRITVYNPRRGRNAQRGLRFLESLVREVGPAMLNKFTVGRLRSRAQARERVRLVQELHDGIVQSLIGLEMQIDHLRRTQAAANNPASLREELRRLQALLHNEIASVREEMQRIKPLQVEPSRFFECLTKTVDRFQRDQGISATFKAEVQEVSLSSPVCTELVRIVQEALVNVRKHSGARKVAVSFGRENGHYRLFVEDDGRGFGFTGLLSSAELEASSQCPSIVRERVRAIGGELMIESNQASGARLQVLVPLTPNGRIASDS